MEPVSQHRAKDESEAVVIVPVISTSPIAPAQTKWAPSLDAATTVTGIGLTIATALTTQSQTASLISGIGASICVTLIRIPFIIEKIGEAWAKAKRLNAQSLDGTLQLQLIESERHKVECEEKLKVQESALARMQTQMDEMQTRHLSETKSSFEDRQQLHRNYEQLRHDYEGLFREMLDKLGFTKPAVNTGTGGITPA